MKYEYKFSDDHIHQKWKFLDPSTLETDQKYWADLGLVGCVWQSDRSWAFYFRKI